MWYLWEMMHLPLVITMIATAQFYQKVDSCGFANDLIQLKTHDWE
jgi:hypothetical protein